VPSASLKRTTLTQHWQKLPNKLSECALEPDGRSRARLHERLRQTLPGLPPPIMKAAAALVMMPVAGHHVGCRKLAQTRRD